MYSRRKKAGQVTALMYLYREIDGEDTTQEVEVSGYFTPEQHQTETDPPINAGIDFETATLISSGQTIVLTEDEIEKATETLIAEIQENDYA